MIALPTSAVAPLLGLEATATRLLWGSAAVFVLANLLLLLAPRGARVGRRLAIVCAGGVIAALGAVLVFGLHSGALILPVVGLHVIGLGGSRWIARGAFLGFAGGHLALAALIELGWLHDPGLVSTGDLPRQARLLLEATVLAVLGGLYLHARRARRDGIRAMRELAAAERSLGERDAQLREAQQELAQSLHLQAEGRWSHQVLGSFRLGRVIGRGAVGEIYAGHHVLTGEPAAIKLLQVETAEVPGNLERFQREARAAASLRSAHVVRVLEVSGAGAPVPYLAMEHLAGADLAAYLRARGRLPAVEVVELVWQLAAGLEVARLAGVVHRDLKPQNVFRTVDGRGAVVWKLLDFGVSKLAGGDGTLTQGCVIGTPHYMSPEQATGRPTDHRADVYGLAALAYRCLTGRPPFAGVEMPALLFHVAAAEPPPAGSLVALPPAVDLVLGRALAKLPEDRYWTAVELAADLAAAVASPGPGAASSPARP